LLAKQDNLRNMTEDMEDIETFFKSQRVIFDEARKLQNSLLNEKDYFATDESTAGKIAEVASILASPKPYGKIQNISGLLQEIKSAYGILLEQKKQEVLGIIQQCMGDVHTLADVSGKASGEVKNSDKRFVEFKQKAVDAISLTVLDAMITQLLNYKDQVCKRIETLLHETPIPDELIGGKPKPQKIAQLRRYDVFPVRRLTTREDVDSYLDGVRQKLYSTLESNDGVQIN
jgi:hypothetical protein